MNALGKVVSATPRQVCNLKAATCKFHSTLFTAMRTIYYVKGLDVAISHDKKKLRRWAKKNFTQAKEHGVKLKFGVLEAQYIGSSRKFKERFPGGGASPRLIYVDHKTILTRDFQWSWMY